MFGHLKERLRLLQLRKKKKTSPQSASERGRVNAQGKGTLKLSSKDLQGGNYRKSDSTIGLFNVPLAVEMFNGRRTVRCRNCNTHLYIPATSSENPRFVCKSCRCLMADPLWTPARPRAGSSTTTISVEPQSRVDCSSDESLVESDNEYSNSETPINDNSDSALDTEGSDWILLDGSCNNETGSVKGKSSASSDNNVATLLRNHESAHAPPFEVNSHCDADGDDLVIITESAPCYSSTVLFDNHVELVETHF